MRNTRRVAALASVAVGLAVLGSPGVASAAPVPSRGYSTACEVNGLSAWSTNFYQTDAGEWRIDLYGERRGGLNAAEVDYWRIEMTDGAGWTMRTYYAQGDGRDSVRITDRILNLRSPVGDGVTDTLRIKTQFRIRYAADKSCIYERPFRR